MSVMEIKMIATPTCRLSRVWHATVPEGSGDILTHATGVYKIPGVLLLK